MPGTRVANGSEKRSAGFRGMDRGSRLIGVSYRAVAGAAIAAFAVSMVWYGAFGEQVAALNGTSAQAMPEVWKIFVELGRSALVATVMGVAAQRLIVASRFSAARLGLAVWIGFPAMILLGSVVWDDVPVALAAIHAGDWLVKLFVVSLIVTVPLRRRSGRPKENRNER